MTLNRTRKTAVAGLATVGITGAASVFGLSVLLFLAGVFGGGALTAAYLAVRDRTHSSS